MAELNAKLESLLQDIRDERIANDVEQPSHLEKLVETIVEDKITLHENYEKLSGDIQALQESLPNPTPSDLNFTWYFSVASLIISILAVMIIVFCKNCLKCDFEDKNSSLEKNIDKLNQEIQWLKSANIALDDKNSSLEKNIDKLNQEIQRLKSANIALDNKNSSLEKNIDEFNRTIQQLNSNVVKHATKAPPSTEEKTSSTNTNFTNDANALILLKSDANFSEKLDAFRRKYNIIAFSCSNSSELIQDSDIEPVFKENIKNNSGDYWAYENGDCYEVVPSPYLQVYNDSVNIGRAFGKVFDSNFKFGGYCTNIKVNKPALFKKSGSQWILKSRGILLLE